MKKVFASFLFVLFIMNILMPVMAADVAQDNILVETLVNGNNEFAINLYLELSTADKNLFFSPYSISSALGMTCAGARENTMKEMRKALKFKLSRKQTHSTFNKLTHLLEINAHKSDQKLSIANALCIISGKISEKYKAFVKSNYAAEIFNGNLDLINAWVKKKTESKIETIMSQLPPNTVCVILNAIYFKGNWDSEFKKSRTREQKFHVTSTKKSTVPMMYQRDNFKLLEKKSFKAVSIPYKGKHMSMLILLPNKIDGLTELEKRLSAKKLSEWSVELAKCPEQKIDLSIPKFKLETDYSLNAYLKNLGMNDAFSPVNADFRNMGWPIGKLWISGIIHKAFVEVNEKGTEAAAITAVTMTRKSIRMYPSFRADHPFIFFIKDNQTGSILFMGKIIDPIAK